MRPAFSRPNANLDEQRELFASFRPAGFEGLQLKGGQYGAYLHEPDRFQQEWSDDPGVV